MANRFLVGAALAFVTFIAGNTAYAQDYPTRPITAVIPFAGGSASDVVSRILFAQMSKSMGQTIVVENRPGAGGNIGTADVAKALQERGGAQVVLATASGGKAVAAAVGGLRRGGVVIALGASDEPIELSAFELLFKQLGVDGAITGTPKAGDATLRFSAMSDVAAMVETMPLERAPEAYARMMSGQARFRMVLTMA